AFDGACQDILRSVKIVHPGEISRSNQKLRMVADGYVVYPFSQSLNPANALNMQPLSIPKHTQRARQANTQRDIPLTKRPCQRGAQIGKLLLEDTTPLVVASEPQLRFGPLGHVHEI